MGAVASAPARRLVVSALTRGQWRAVAVLAALALAAVAASRGGKRRRVRHGWDYARVSSLIKTQGLAMPCMLVDMDALERNAAKFASAAAAQGKTIRIGTKSIRVPHVIFHLLRRYPSVYRGLMCFSVLEAEALANMAPAALGEDYESLKESGALDAMLAYPTLQMSDVRVAYRLAERGEHTAVTLTVDCVRHVEMLDELWEAAAAEHAAAAAASRPSRGGGDVVATAPTVNFKCPVSIDADMSYRPFGGLLHLGAHRSPCRTLADVEALVDAIAASRYCTLRGVMGYEAQVVGIMDANPFLAYMNPVARVLKSLSLPDVFRKRAAIKHMLDARGVKLAFFNGGGSSGAAAIAADPAVSEITVGSGIFQSTIFDWYRDCFAEPALAFALQCTRSCEAGVITCQSGGFIASGEVSQDKTPQPFLPEGLTSFGPEGYGEVQTPFQVSSSAAGAEGVRATDLTPGDPVLLRPAKAGEIGERFNSYVLLRERQTVVEAKVPTYRGLGFAFF